MPISIRRWSAAAGACTAQQLFVHSGGGDTYVPHPGTRLQEVMRLHCFSIEPQPGPAGAAIVIMEWNYIHGVRSVQLKLIVKLRCAGG
jgi:hypothetical protein